RISATASQPERSKPGQKKIEDCGSKSGQLLALRSLLSWRRKETFPLCAVQQPRAAAAPPSCPESELIRGHPGARYLGINWTSRTRQLAVWGTIKVIAESFSEDTRKLRLLVDLELFGLQLLQLSSSSKPSKLKPAPQEFPIPVFIKACQAGTLESPIAPPQPGAAARIGMREGGPQRLNEIAALGCEGPALRSAWPLRAPNCRGAATCRSELNCSSQHCLIHHTPSLALGSNGRCFAPLGPRARRFFAVQLGPRRSQLRTAIGFPGRLRARSAAAAPGDRWPPLLSCHSCPTQRKCSGAKLVFRVGTETNGAESPAALFPAHIHHYHFHETQLANGRLARDGPSSEAAPATPLSCLSPQAVHVAGLGPPIGRDGAGRDLRAAAIGQSPSMSSAAPAASDNLHPSACEQPETRQSQHSYIDLAPRESPQGENYPTHQLQTQRSLLASRPTQRCSTPLPPRPPGTSASGGTGGGAGGSATSAAAAAAAAALLESRQPHQHHGHPQHPALAPAASAATITRGRQRSAANPFDPQSRIPLPHPFGEFHFGCESSFIRRRNERERERVRFNKDKRISKVEILKTAIRYIQHMESLLRAADQQQQAEPPQLRPEAAPPRPELQAEPQEKRLRPA
uniref:BHLH domain-containing protein n=1 Tax=Macrostomum lignano TaxID=282301 RepID=A0A1I8FTX8_9PLAT